MSSECRGADGFLFCAARRYVLSARSGDFLGYPQNLLHPSAEFNLMFTRCFHPGRRHNPVAAPQIDYIALRTSRDRTAVNVRNSKHCLINGQDSSNPLTDRSLFRPRSDVTTSDDLWSAQIQAATRYARLTLGCSRRYPGLLVPFRR